MKSIPYAAAAVSSFFFAVLPVLGQTPSPTQAYGAIVTKGCYSTGYPLEDQGAYTFQTSGYCQKVCVALNKPVMATTGGSNCWCGDELPPTSDKVADNQCNSPCQGYQQDTCGGDMLWTVALAGIGGSVPVASPSSSSAAATTKASSTVATSPTLKTEGPSVVTIGGPTKVVTASGQSTAAAPTETTKKHGSGTNKAGIAAGVVVGVVALSAIIGGALVYLRMRRRRAIEEEYRRNAALTGFGGAKPGSASSVSDSRLEPSVMMQRRQSDGSIADNQDYSRRILKVTNPDGS
ncbi:MAG: hypothetical protein M1819_003104 [Sarea resinae]|nr:MAG: hypothetical protein M1819_003104 [Sarea resinae]